MSGLTIPAMMDNVVPVSTLRLAWTGRTPRRARRARVDGEQASRRALPRMMLNETY